MTDFDKITVDESFIEDTFDNFKNKDLMEMFWIIYRYNNIYDKLKEQKYIVDLIKTFPNKKERTLVEESRDYLKNKGIKFSITRQKYRRVIKEYLDDAEIIYKNKKEESYLIRREKEKEHAKECKLCSCGAFITIHNYARHLLSKKHINLDKNDNNHKNDEIK